MTTYPPLEGYTWEWFKADKEGRYPPHWNRCTFCFGFVWQTQKRWRGESPDGLYVAHAHDACHQRVYGQEGATA